MIAFLIISVIIFSISFCFLIPMVFIPAKSIKKELSIIGVMIGFILTVISISLHIERTTSIHYLNNNPIYDKHYIINEKNEIIDSVYVKIPLKLIKK